MASDAPEDPNHLLRPPSLRYVVVAHKSPEMNESGLVWETFYDTLPVNLISPRSRKYRNSSATERVMNSTLVRSRVLQPFLWASRTGRSALWRVLRVVSSATNVSIMMSSHPLLLPSKYKPCTTASQPGHIGTGVSGSHGPTAQWTAMSAACPHFTWMLNPGLSFA